MRSSLLRAPTAVRQLANRRLASTTASTATSEASAKAQDAAKKAQDAAKVAAVKLGAAASGLGTQLMKIGGRTGRLIHRVNGMIPTAQYYSRVGLELSRIVFHGQTMAPPKLETFKTTFSPVLNTLKGLQSTPSATLSTLSSSTASIANTNPHSILTAVRNISRTQVAQVGVIVAEVIGFFTVGEIIGRRKLVGYRGDSPAAAHH